MSTERRSSPRNGETSREPGALYVHLQSENGTEHRTLVLSARRAQVLRTLWSRWGVALLLAVSGSWVYFAFQSFRIPPLTRRVAELETEGARIDTLQTELLTLQRQYEQVQHMLGATPPKIGADTLVKPGAARRNP